MTALPGLPGRPVWLLLYERDVEAMRAETQPGQVWVNVTDLDLDQDRELWGVISYQQQRLGKPLGKPGRPGLTNEECIEAARLKDDEGWTHTEIGKRFGWPLQANVWRKPQRCRTSDEAVKRGRILRT